MNFDMQNVTAKLCQGDAVTHLGTAWLCSRDFALTAAHCIEPKETPVPRTQLFRLRFRWGVLEGVVTWIDHNLDAALLHITGGAIHSIPDTIDEFSIEDLPTSLEDTPTWLAYGFPLAKQDGMFVDGTIVSGRAPLGRYEAIQLTCKQGGFEPIKGFNPERQTEAEVLTLAGLSGAAVTHGAAVVGLISWGPAMLRGTVIYAIPVQLISSACREFAEACAIQRDKYFQRTKRRLARIGGASKFSGKIEAFFEEYLITETGPRTVPFGGRDEDLALLDAWLDEETAPPRYLLTAPAGRGKSALLVRWLQHLQEQGSVGRDAPASWQLVFVPISIRFETHRPDIFYEALAARLAEILGEELPPTHTAKDVYYADHCRILASAAVAQGRRILIVLDGIDETLGERFDARWFPRNPGTRLRLVLSARWQAGDLDSLGWQIRLGWERDVRVQSRELPVLAREGVRELLIKMGAPTDVLASRPDIVHRLHDVAEGEPLVLRYYAEDIWGMGEASTRLTMDDLAQMQPGFGAYFKRWLDEQAWLWRGAEDPVDRQRVNAILAILACAHGRLRGADLRALLAERGEAAPGGRFLEQLEPIQRFVIGLDRPEAETAGYILSHPKLGIHLREEHFDLEDILATRAAFVRWGRKTVEQLNRGALGPEETPAYLLQYHTQHLYDAAGPADAFLDLVEQGWLRAWEAFEGGYRGFSRDIRLVYEALSKVHAADQPRFAQRLRCQLVLSSIHSIGANTPWELLVAACKAGVQTCWQVAHWLEFKPSADRAKALGALALHLPAELLPDALTAVWAIVDSSARTETLGALAPHLPAELRAEVLSDALTAVRAIEDSFSRTFALDALVRYLPAELLPDALTAARAIEDSASRARVLGELVRHLPAKLLPDALTPARVIEDSSSRVRALGKLAPHLPAELLPDALTAARAIEDSFARTETLGALAPHLPAELRAEVQSDALTAALAIEDSFARAAALGRLAPQLSGNLLQQGFEELLDVLPRCRRDASLSAVSSFFPFLGEFQGLKGLEEVRHAIIDTARWFP